MVYYYNEQIKNGEGRMLAVRITNPYPRASVERRALPCPSGNRDLINLFYLENKNIIIIFHVKKSFPELAVTVPGQLVYTTCTRVHS